MYFFFLIAENERKLQEEIEELKRKKGRLEEQKTKLEEKVDDLEAKHQKLTDEISKSAIFTNSKSHTSLRIDLSLLLPGCCSNVPVDRN